MNTIGTKLTQKPAQSPYNSRIERHTLLVGDDLHTRPIQFVGARIVPIEGIDRDRVPMLSHFSRQRDNLGFGTAVAQIAGDNNDSHVLTSTPNFRNTYSLQPRPRVV